MANIPSFKEAHLQAICDVIGDTVNGLTGAEIGRLLRQCGINDPYPSMTKRHRLFQALNDRQLGDRCGNNVAGFVVAAMDPARYPDDPESFDDLRDRLNKALAFCGMHLSEDGQLRRTDAVRTITGAQGRAGRLRVELERRNVHPDVLRFCRAELLQENYFHAVLEATKSVGDKVRAKSGLTTDGSQLVDQAFGIRKKGLPVLAFNSLRTETERNEHIGLMNLMKGIFSAFRNPAAHAPKIQWPIKEQDAFDLLSLLSLLHRRLDGAVRASTHSP